MINHYSSVHLFLTSNPINQVQYQEIHAGLVTDKTALTQLFLHVLCLFAVNHHSVGDFLVYGQ
jgi:hypothetical protein